MLGILTDTMKTTTTTTKNKQTNKNIQSTLVVLVLVLQHCYTGFSLIRTCPDCTKHSNSFLKSEDSQAFLSKTKIQTETTKASHAHTDNCIVALSVHIHNLVIIILDSSITLMARRLSLEKKHKRKAGTKKINTQQTKVKLRRRPFPAPSLSRRATVKGPLKGNSVLSS